MFSAATAASGVASGAGFSYTEAGYFRLGVDGVYDSTFTAVDQPNDCTNDFSNTLVGGKYGCKFGNASNTSYFGRFIPDHFTTVVTQGCTAGAFTYSGQPFTVRVSALNSAGNPTSNYDGVATPVFAKAVTLTDGNGATVGGFGGTNSIGAGVFSSGVATVNTPTYTFTTSKTVPTIIKLRATESAGGDGVTSSGFAEGTTTERAGRLMLRSAYGSELMRLPIPLEAQFWQEGGNAAITTDDYWTTNTADSCTSIPAGAISMGNYKGNLAAGETSVTIGGTFAAGIGSLSLSAPGAGNSGSTDVTINNGTANVPWFGANEAARATFGLRKTPVIYMRENY
jgi:MSHA biogenesis protein MshQ